MQNPTRREFLSRAGTFAGATALAAVIPGEAPLWAQSSGSDLAFMSASELARLLHSKEVGSEELTRLYIDRIERYDATVNSVVVRDFERALDAARAADRALASGTSLGRLHGLPMTIKESYDVAGLPTTWGIPSAADHVAAADSVVVERFKEAGAHFLGKTNVPINLADFQSYNDIYGTTRNPWNTERTPGGSSGGSAAALAAGLTGLESGSDIGSSIRNPAHYCGVYGHKPTRGVVPMRGHTRPGVPRVPQTPDLAVVGPLARSVEDLALALEITGGPDVLHAPGWRLDLPEARMASLRGLRVALWPDDTNAPVAREVSERVDAIGRKLSDLGARVSDTARPKFDAGAAHGIYLTILNAMMGFPGGELDYRAWMALHGQRNGFRLAWKSFFEDWDILLCPTSATTAFPHDQETYTERVLLVDGIERAYFEQLFWAGLATLSYLPSTVFPTGLSREGLPIGLQAIGAEFDDRTTIRFAQLIADEIGGFSPPPAFV